jgi:hypothetical protein
MSDQQWMKARLIPVSSASGKEAQERRPASATLAVMGSVPEFGRALLKPLGAPAGKVETFTSCRTTRSLMGHLSSQRLA